MMMITLEAAALPAPLLARTPVPTSYVADLLKAWSKKTVSI